MTQVCQATFKEHCQYPKCDCDRPVTAEVINSTEFPRLKNIPERYYCRGAEGPAGHCDNRPQTIQCDYCIWKEQQKDTELLTHDAFNTPTNT